VEKYAAYMRHMQHICRIYAPHIIPHIFPHILPPKVPHILRKFSTINQHPYLRLFHLSFYRDDIGCLKTHGFFRIVQNLVVVDSYFFLI